MGTFTVEVTAKNPQEPARSRTLSLLVDTGASYAVLPLDVVEALGVQPVGSRRVRFTNGRADQWPIAIVLMTLEGQEWPTMCLVGPRGGPALLGAVTLEQFALGVDPLAMRLVPVESSLMACAR
jgi:predicted aspartyl protease